MSKLWGGRFSKPTSSNLTILNHSLPIDCRLFAEDIDGSKAYAEALNNVGVLNDIETQQITNGLELIRYEWIENLIKFQNTDEDVHTVNERRLIEIIGSVGEKLHTGRSRNDQVITDMKLWLKKALKETVNSIKIVIDESVKLAEKYKSVLMPGYTHLQRAQPILFAHWLLSHTFALYEDCQRLEDFAKRVDLLPLGSGALAGNPFGINRELLAKKLDFSGVTKNSMHAVGDRDFAVEFIFCCSMVSLHLSRLSEDLIIYATKEFNFIQISDEYSTGSSLMPQKRNPDSLELIRGSSGKIFSCLTGLMMTIKGTPSTYNKDLQSDKKYIFDSFDTTKQILDVIQGVLSTLTVNKIVTENSLSADMLATDFAHYLVKKGIPFRTAHHLVGQIITFAEVSKLELNEVPLTYLKTVSDKFDKDIMNLYDYKASTEQYTVTGGTSTKSVQQQIQFLKEFLNKNV